MNKTEVLVTSDEEFIKGELLKFDVTDAGIAAIKEKCEALEVESAEDVKGYRIVKGNRIAIRSLRTGVEKTRKKLLEKPLEFTRIINGEAKRITALLEPMEEDLRKKEKVVDDEIERRRTEKAEAAKKRLEARVAEIYKVGLVFDGVSLYRYKEMKVSYTEVVAMDEARFDSLLVTLNKYVVEQKEKEEEGRKQKEKEDAERAAKDKRLAEQKAEQDKKAKAQREEQDKIDNENTRIARERAEAKIKEEARKQAEKDAALKVKREKEEEDARKKKAADAEELRVSRLPDNQKMLEAGEALERFLIDINPDLKFHESKTVFMNAREMFDAGVAILKRGVTAD